MQLKIPPKNQEIHGPLLGSPGPGPMFRLKPPSHRPCLLHISQFQVYAYQSISSLLYKQYMGTAQVLFVVVLPEMASPEMTSPQDTSPKATGTGSREPETGNEREIISRVFVPVFPGFFPRNSSRFQVRTMEL